MLSSVVRIYRQSPAAFIVLAVGITYSCFAWIYTRGDVEREGQRAFESQIVQAHDALSDAVLGYTELLYGLQGLFGAVKDVNRSAFRRYVDMSDIANRYPGTLAFSFIREVPLHKKELYEQIVRGDTSVDPDGYPDFSIKPNEIKPFYWVIEYVAPAEDKRALGLDISSFPALYATGVRARDTGLPATAGRPSIDRADSPAANLVIYVPIYRGDLPQRTIEQRRRAFLGLVAVVARPSDLINAALERAKLHDVHVAVYDLGIAQSRETMPATLVYQTDGPHGIERAQRLTTVEVGGRLWQLAITPHSQFGGSVRPLFVLAGGLLTTALVFSLLRRLALSNATALQLTEEIRANMRAREARFRSLTENAMEVTSVLSERGVVLYQTASGEKVFGLKPQEMLGSNVFDRVHPDEMQTVRAAAADLNPEQVRVLEFRMRGADGDWRNVETSWNNRLEDPAVKGIVVNWRDVTQRKRAEADLKESEERFKIVASSTNDAVWDWDVVTGNVSWNEGLRILFGYSEREGERAWWTARIHAEDRERVLSEIDSLVASARRFWSGEYRFLRADGSYAYVLDRGYVIRDEHGKAVRMIGAMLDLSERNRAEQALKESEQRYRSLVTATASVVWLADARGEFVLPQPSWEAYTGQRYAEYRGHGWLNAIHPHDREHMRTMWKHAVRAQSSYEVEGRVWHTPTRDYRWFVMRAIPLTDADGSPREWVGIVRDVTERRQAEERLRESEGQLRLVADSLPVLIAYVDADERFRFNNAAYQRWFNIGGESLAGRKVGEALGPETYSAIKPYLQQALSGRTVGYDRQIALKDGEQRFVHATYVPHIEDDGRVRGFFSLVTDITERKKSEEALAESEEKFRVIAENVEDLIVLLDTEGRRLYRSPSYRAVLGEAHSGEDSFAEVHPEDRERIRRIFEQTVKTGIGHRTQFRFLLKDGSARHIESQGSVIRDAHGKVTKVVVVSRDITERKHAEAYIRHLAHHDGLTGLPNRVLLADRLGVAIVQAHRDQRRAGVLFIDLDRFKEVNDKLGHQAGDRLLQSVAERTQASVREGDTVARLGGDEFVVLLPVIRDHSDTQRVANKILENLSRPYTLEGQALMVTPSIGIAVYPDDGSTVEDLMRNADAAMYHAKQLGRNNCQFFNPAMNPATNVRFTVEAQLKRALEQDQLLLHYQPIVDVKTGEIRSVEALLRWQQPGGGLSLPSKIIPIAEDSGLIVPIGEWALEAACKAAKRFREAAGQPNLRVAVNLSPRHFRKRELASHISDMLEACGLSPSNLELEVTENVIMEFGEESVAVLRAVKEMGVALTVDDFGTGYSSLSYLKHFPVDRLKVDKVFVREVTSNADDAAIVTAVIVMAHGLELKVVAEGVETREQLDFLRANNCDEAQGSYFSPAVSEDELIELLKKRSLGREGGRVIPLRAGQDKD